MARANRFRGKERWLRGLRQLKPEVRLEIEKATEANARDMVKTAKSFAPRDKGDLANSIKAEGRRDGPAVLWRVTAGDEKAFYARMVEFGTAPGVKGATATNSAGRKRKVARTHPGNAAQPYFFTAYRALRKRMKGRLSRGLGRAKRKVFPK